MPEWTPCPGPSDLFSPQSTRFHPTFARRGGQIKQIMGRSPSVVCGDAQERRAETIRFFFWFGLGMIVAIMKVAGPASRPWHRKSRYETEDFQRSVRAGPLRGHRQEAERQTCVVRSRPQRVPWPWGILSAAMLALSPAFAADSATCSMAVKLLEATDRGLEAAAAGDARGATSGIAVFALQTHDMAEQYSQDDPLPDALDSALIGILAETATRLAASTPRIHAPPASGTRRRFRSGSSGSARMRALRPSTATVAAPRAQNLSPH